MNNKTYANYLMHGRTKGSRNGISTTKGYTAVGQKAKGKIVNGKYVYANNNENTQSGIVVKPTSNNWQQQAALEQWKKQNQNAIAAKKKKAEAFDKASDAYRLGISYPVADEANRTRTVNEHYNKNWKNNTTIDYDAPGSGSYLDAKKAKDTAYLKGRNAVNKATMNGANTNASQQAELERWKQQNRNNIAAKKTAEAKAQAAKDAAWNKKVYKARKPTNIGAAQAGNTARAMKEYMTKASADRKAKAQSAKQLTNIGASQSADLARWAQQNRNNIAASKKAAKQQELIKKADASYAANQGKANNWQAQANTQRAMKEYMNKASDERKAESAKRSASYNKMSSTQKNAMQNDPRYSTGLGVNNSAMLYSGPRGKYDYSGKNDSRAPTLITFNGSEKMNRDPYFETWAKSTNKQEVAAAQAKNKEFMNDFRKSKERNSRSDIGNALADAKEDAKNAFKALKNKFKKKKKK